MPGKPIMGGSKQAAAVPGGLGSDDRGDGLAMNNTAATLQKMAGYFVSFAQAGLRRDGSNATGAGEASISASEIYLDGSKMTVDINWLDRLKFINSGVKGVESGAGKYSFKTKFANKKMATNILKWLRKRGARAVKYAPVRGAGRKTETKDKALRGMTDRATDLKGMAYAISVNIKKKGIRATHFFDKAQKATERVFRAEVAKGFKLDIIDSFKGFK